MRVTVEIDVEPLPENRLLAFHSTVGSAHPEGHEFEITRAEAGSPSFGFHEKVDGLTVVHTVSLIPVIEAAIEAIVNATVCTGCGTQIVSGEDCPNYGSGAEHA